MSDEKKTPEVKEPELPKANMFESALSSDLRKEYDELKLQYKSAKLNAKTVAERVATMKLWQDTLIDFAIESRILKDWTFNTELNQEIDSITRRVSTGSRGW